VFWVLAERLALARVQIWTFGTWRFLIGVIVKAPLVVLNLGCGGRATRWLLRVTDPHAQHLIDWPDIASQASNRVC